jgi:hypothetical protein
MVSKTLCNSFSRANSSVTDIFEYLAAVLLEWDMISVQPTVKPNDYTKNITLYLEEENSIVGFLIFCK